MSGAGTAPAASLLPKQKEEVAEGQDTELPLAVSNSTLALCSTGHDSLDSSSLCNLVRKMMKHEDQGEKVVKKCRAIHV